MIDNEIYKHIVMFSGGVCSWAAAKRVVERHGKEGVVLLFADTKMEDEDLYRFLNEAAHNVGVPLIRIADGRNPWEVMRDVRFIANSRTDPCSMILKRNLLDKWRNAHGKPDYTTVHLGLDWTEMHRVEKVNKLCVPWRYEAPMASEPYLTKCEMQKMLLAEGIQPPRLYALGFPHNNCGGFCVKAGQAQFALLHKTFPERYAWHEAQEEQMRQLVGDHSVLKDRRGGKPKPMSLRAFRERIESGDYDKHEWGGCGCAIE